MTISSTPRKAGPYTGNGASTTWPFTFKAFTQADVQVTVANTAGVETLLTLGVDYTVALNVNQDTSPGGTVTHPISGSPLPVGAKLTVTGYVEYDQQLDLPSGGNFSPASLENQLDRIVMQVQQVRETSARAVQVGVTTDVAVTLPPPAPNRLIGWNPAGTGLQNVPIDDLATGVVFAAYRYDVFTGNGTTTTFPLVVDPVVIGNVYVTVDGVVKLPILDYNLANGALSFIAAPSNGTKILAHYGEAAPGTNPSGSPVTFSPTVQSFSGDGTTTAFTLLVAPGSANALVVRISGSVQTPDVDYYVSGATLTFTEAPPAGSGNIVAQNFGIAVPVGTLDPALDASLVKIVGNQTITGAKRGAVTTDNDLSFSMAEGNNFSCTTSGSGTLTFTNITAGQSGFILLVNAANHTISAAATTKVGASTLTTISATGTYLLSYFSNGTNVYVVNSGAFA
jgi:hypothetical protein